MISVQYVLCCFWLIILAMFFHDCCCYYYSMKGQQFVMVVVIFHMFDLDDLNWHHWNHQLIINNKINHHSNIEKTIHGSYCFVRNFHCQVCISGNIVSGISIKSGYSSWSNTIISIASNNFRRYFSFCLSSSFYFILNNKLN